MPQWASIGGIPALVAEFFLNTQGFAGKKIALIPTRRRKRPSRPATELYKALMLNILLPSRQQHGARALGMDLTLATQNLRGDRNLNGNGVTDPFRARTELSQALMNAVGVKGLSLLRRTRRCSRSRWSPTHRSADHEQHQPLYGRSSTITALIRETFDRRRDSNGRKLCGNWSDERQGRMVAQLQARTENRARNPHKSVTCASPHGFPYWSVAFCRFLDRDDLFLCQHLLARPALL